MAIARQIDVLALVAVMLAACKGDAAADSAPSKDQEPTSMSELGTSSGDGGVPEVAGDLCSNAPAIRTRTYEGSLFNAAADLDASDVAALGCDSAGPDVFVALTTARRADIFASAEGTGFAPTVAILGPSCADAFACAVGLPASMLDVAANTDLVIAIGVAADDPAVNAASAPEDLGFRLAITEREILGAGATCGLPGQGRCETGSACIVDAETGTTSKCTVIDGDTCETATAITLTEGHATTMIDPTVLYSDAHRHSCTGARRRDRVLHVQWDAPGGTLVASTTLADVGLALRGPGCAASEELACASATAEGSRAEADVVGPGSAFVFVELPADDPAGGGTSELGPFALEIAIEPQPED